MKETYSEMKRGDYLFKNVVISILSVIVMMQTNFFRPHSGIMTLLMPVIWYFVIASTLTWIDLVRLANKEREKEESRPKDPDDK